MASMTPDLEAQCRALLATMAAELPGDRQARDAKRQAILALGEQRLRELAVDLGRTPGPQDLLALYLAGYQDGQRDDTRKGDSAA